MGGPSERKKLYYEDDFCRDLFMFDLIHMDTIADFEFDYWK